MYNTNSYMGNMQYNTQPYNSYGYNNYAMYQPQVQNQLQTMGQKPAQAQDFPFSVVRFGTLDEAKAHIVPPSKAIMFIKSDFSELYVKSADAMGNPALETFKCSRVNENPTLPQTPVLDSEIFAKREELKNFVTADDIKGLSTKKEMEDMSEKLNSIENDIKKLNRLSELIGGKNDGKQSK